MITLNTILGIDEKAIDEYKIHFAIGIKSNNRDEPLNAYRNNTFKEWQERQSKKNFELPFIISLIYSELTNGYLVVFIKAMDALLETESFIMRLNCWIFSQI